MSEITVRHKCKCVECGNSHWAYVRQEELPVGIHCTVKPYADDDKSWVLTVIDYSLNDEVVFEAVCDNMKGVLWNIENVAFEMHRRGYRCVVELPTSRFETHSRINRLEWSEYVAEHTTDAKEHWYLEVVRRACRQSVRSANKIGRVGY